MFGCTNAQLTRNRGQAVGFAGQRSQYVETLDVARAFPDRIQRCLAVQARQDRFLDVARPPEAFLRLVDHHRRALADPILAHGGEHTGQRCLFGVTLGRSIQGTGQSQRHRQRCFRLQSQIGQHVLHQRLVRQQPAECLPMLGVMHGLAQGLAHQRCRADHAVEPGMHDHLQNGGHTATFLAHHDGPGLEELHLAGRVSVIAQLVLQPLDPNRVLGAIGLEPRHQKTGQSALALCQDQKCIAHRGREKPLVADQSVGLTRAGLADRCRPCGVRTDIRATLLFGHPHADGGPVFVSQWQKSSIVVSGQDLRQPLFGHLRLVAQRGDRGIGHGQRAAGPRLGLTVEVGQRGTHHLRAFAGPGPRQ